MLKDDMTIAIVGAGLIGRLLAWRLLEAGHKVSLYDRDDKSATQSAAFVAAAMLAPITEVLDAEPEIYTHGVAGLSIWPQWAQELQQTTGIDISCQIEGSLLLSHRNDMADYQRCLQRLRAHSAVDQSTVIDLDRAQLAAMEEELAHGFDKALWLSDEGCLDNWALLRALEKRISDLGGLWFENSHFEYLNHATLHEHFSDFDKVLDCRGMAAKTDQKDLRGVRGEIIRVKASNVNIRRPVRLMHPRYNLYISPKPEHEYVVGATQIESESEHPVTVRSSLELLSALYSIHKGFSESEIIAQYARCRPAYSDNMPKISCHGNLISINGLYRHGYLLSPVVVNETLALFNLADSTWPEIIQITQEGLTA